MRTPDRFEFTATARNNSEAMIAVSKALQKGRYKVMAIIFTLILTTLTGLGGMALATLIASFLDINPSWWMVIGWFAGGAFYLMSFPILYREMSKQITMCALHQVPQAITFDEVGITYEALPAIWKTPWSMVDDILETKQTITVVVAGISFALPKASVGDADAVAALLNDLKAQIAHA